MAGIYLHIPFCKQACHYCNFHFSTSLKLKKDFLEALKMELVQRKDYLGKQAVRTVYFGGGTPSLLSAEEINDIWATLNEYYDLSEIEEVTLEANPDDLTKAYLQSLRSTAINRFSIGVQSFFEEDLTYMNRAHNAADAKRCILDAQEAGFSNLTIDLIYGGPTTSHENWRANLQMAFDLNVPHISCYAMTVEPQTALEHFIEKGKAKPVDEQHTAEQFEILLKQMVANGYEQYEISNFCKPPHYAKHNSNYWLGAHYVGVGPSAHSFNGHSRAWNIAHNPKYIELVTKNGDYWEEEVLSIANQYNEYIMTSLRTKWGIDKKRLEQWGNTAVTLFEQEAATYISRGLIYLHEGRYKLSDEGKLIGDAIMSDLFWAE